MMAARIRYYVYKLIDPRNNEPFYVGKGCGNRVYEHVKQARPDSNHPKTRRIIEISESGSEVVHEIVRWFASEDAAYRYEAKLIKQIGRGRLTNLTDGGRGAPSWVRATVSCKDAEEEKDRLVVGVLAFFSKKTAGFMAQPLMRVSGEWVPLASVKLESLRERLDGLISKRGIDWVNLVAKAERVVFEPSKVEALDGAR